MGSLTWKFIDVYNWWKVSQLFDICSVLIWLFWLCIVYMDAVIIEWAFKSPDLVTPWPCGVHTCYLFGTCGCSFSYPIFIIPGLGEGGRHFYDLSGWGSGFLHPTSGKYYFRGFPCRPPVLSDVKGFPLGTRWSVDL